MQSSHTTALPALDLRALARRAALPAALAVVAVAAFVAAGGPLQAFADALGRALDADPRWIAAAVVFELLSFVGYVVLLWLVGRRATRRLGLRESTEVSLGGAAATRLLPTGGVGGAALTIWAFRRAGLDGRPPRAPCSPSSSCSTRSSWLRSPSPAGCWRSGSLPAAAPSR